MSETFVFEEVALDAAKYTAHLIERDAAHYGAIIRSVKENPEAAATLFDELVTEQPFAGPVEMRALRTIVAAGSEPCDFATPMFEEALRRSFTTTCWACGEILGRCICGAPVWPGRLGPAGCYVLGSRVGMLKIGTSGRLARRCSELTARGIAGGVEVRAVLWGAPRSVEQWLHNALAIERDPDAAKEASLPAHTEWFWPTKRARDLIARATAYAEIRA